MATTGTYDNAMKDVYRQDLAKLESRLASKTPRGWSEGNASWKRARMKPPGLRKLRTRPGQVTNNV